MFARMATFSVTDPDRAAGMSERIREAALPVTEQLQGWQGATQMLDRESGKLAVIHFFDTAENMEAAEPTFESMPQQFPEDLRQQVQEVAAGRQSIEKYEVLGEHRSSG